MPIDRRCKCIASGEAFEWILIRFVEANGKNHQLTAEQSQAVALAEYISESYLSLFLAAP